jgi:two-component system, NarL family, nitrate/nitrite response regulator NarL
MQYVLIVEDDPYFARNMQEAIHNCGNSWPIRIASTGSEALELINRTHEHIALALVDLGLPDIGGTEVIRALHQRAPETPIMVLSVIAAERSLIIAIEAGARGYVLKSDPSEAVERSIRDMLAGNYPISPSLARYLFKRISETPGEPGNHDMRLSPQQQNLLLYLAQGCNYNEAAQAMGVKLSTIQTHIRNLYRKLNAHSKTQAVAKAREQGLI